MCIRDRAIIAGSTPILFANNGRIQPINFATITTIINERATTIAILKFWYCMKIRKPLAAAKINPTTSEILNSLNMTLKISLRCV